MRDIVKGLFFRNKKTKVNEHHTPIELTSDEMKQIEGASSEYLDHFYEKNRVKGIVDPIYQKII
jgi:hypothetical protein